MPREFRLYLDSVAGGWNAPTFNLYMPGILGDVSKNTHVKLRLEQFVWDQRVQNLNVAYRVNLLNVNQLGTYGSTNGVVTPQVLHVGTGFTNSFYRADTGAEITVDTNWLKQQVLKVSLTQLNGSAFTPTYYGTNAAFFMCLVITYDD